MQQVSGALNPVTLIDTKHHEVGALESALSEPISLTPSPLPGSLFLSRATDNAGQSQSTFASCSLHGPGKLMQSC